MSIEWFPMTLKTTTPSLFIQKAPWIHPRPQHASESGLSWCQAAGTAGPGRCNTSCKAMQLFGSTLYRMVYHRVQHVSVAHRCLQYCCEFFWKMYYALWKQMLSRPWQIYKPINHSVLATCVSGNAWKACGSISHCHFTAGAKPKPKKKHEEHRRTDISQAQVMQSYNHSSLIFFTFEQTLIHSTRTVRRNTCWAAMELSKRIADNQISACNTLSQFKFALFRKSQTSNGPRHLQPYGCNFKPSNAQVAALSQFRFIVSTWPQHFTTRQADATFQIKASVSHIFKVHQMCFTGETLSIFDEKIRVQSISVGILEFAQNNRIQSLGPPLQDRSVVKTPVEDG